MDKIQITGGRQLKGEITIQGSKNAAIPVLAAALMVDGEVFLKNCPRISDIYDALELMTETGCIYRWEDEGLYINSSKVARCSINNNKAKATRVSILMLGALAGRLGCAGITSPGGCSIGKRPVDKHLEVFNKLGINTREEEDYISCKAVKHVGSFIKLDIRSVGVTENAVLAATLAEGMTIITNAAKEPEVDVLCDFLNSAGASIMRTAPDIIVVEGVKRLGTTEYTLPSDRIVAGTYLTAIAAAGGAGTIKNVESNSLSSVLEVLEAMGSKIFRYENEITLFSEGQLKTVPKITTGPYPEFPTDMQSQIMALLAKADGESVVSEKIFESRFLVVPELVKMGADITILGDSAYIRGVKRFRGTDVEAKELRGGAALVIAGLMAEGKTTISNIGYIKRGYEDICADICCLGADIKVV